MVKEPLFTQHRYSDGGQYLCIKEERINILKDAKMNVNGFDVDVQVYGADVYDMEPVQGDENGTWTRKWYQQINFGTIPIKQDPNGVHPVTMQADKKEFTDWEIHILIEFPPHYASWFNDDNDDNAELHMESVSDFIPPSMTWPAMARLHLNNQNDLNGQTWPAPVKLFADAVSNPVHEPLKKAIRKL
jgi:hypothetical protein